jgi:hypothetical protein
LKRPEKPRIVAGMATQPSRVRTARRVVSKLISQVDILVVHLDGFSEVPSWMEHEKIRTNVFPERSRVGAGGKLDCLEHCLPGDLVVLVDDDVRLRKETIPYLLEGLSRQERNSVVGFHGSLLPVPVESYLKSRRYVHLADQLTQDTRVDVIATCLTAWKFSDFAPKAQNWPFYNMVDLQFSLDAHVAGVELFLIKRRRNFIRFLAEKQPDSIYSKLLDNDTVQTGLAREIRDLRQSSNRP